MAYKPKFLIFGGDIRQFELIKLLLKNDFSIKVFGFDDLVKSMDFNLKNICVYNRLSNELFDDVDVLMLPIPCTDKYGYIRFIDKNAKIKCEDIIRYINKQTIIILGKPDTNLIKATQENDIKLYDLLQYEEFAIANAVPTAEGAIQYAMENSKITLCGSNCLITGYGRISKTLSKMLHGIGANVTVAVRKKTDLLWIQQNGYNPINICDMDLILQEQDFIFNTVPSIIFDSSKLKKVNKDVLIIELASSPGGIDLSSAEKEKINIIQAQGLPGIVAPMSSAKIIYDLTVNICSGFMK